MWRPSCDVYRERRRIEDATCGCAMLEILLAKKGEFRPINCDLANWPCVAAAPSFNGLNLTTMDNLLGSGSNIRHDSWHADQCLLCSRDMFLYYELLKQSVIQAINVSVPPKAHTEADSQAPHIVPPSHRDIQAFSLTEDRLHILGLTEEWKLHVQPSWWCFNIHLASITHVHTTFFNPPWINLLTLCGTV